MRDFVPWKKQFKYPHMRDFEIALIEKLIEQQPKLFEKVAYSFPVGHGAPADPIVNEETGGSIEYDYFKKIDILGKNSNAFFIVEAKKKARASAVGQVLGYRDLFVLDEKPTIKPVCIILTDVADPDFSHIAKMQGVQVIVV